MATMAATLSRGLTHGPDPTSGPSVLRRLSTRRIFHGLISGGAAPNGLRALGISPRMAGLPTGLQRRSRTSAVSIIIGIISEKQCVGSGSSHSTF